MDMKYQAPKLTDREILEIFPGAKEIIPKKIKEWEEEMGKNEKELGKRLVIIYSKKLDEFSTWFWERVAQSYWMPAIMKASGHILRLKRMKSIYSPSGKKLEHWQEQVERARQYSIEEMARSKLDLRPAGKNFIALCPFHNEKTSSFYLYVNTNTFHCFGCQENGDVIKLTMHVYGIDFKEAVRMLQKN